MSKGPKLDEKRYQHDCVLIEESGISVIYVASGWWYDANDNADHYLAIETLRLTNDNFAENKWTIEKKIEKKMFIYGGGLQLVKSNAKNHLFYLVGGRKYKAKSIGKLEKQIWALTQSKNWEPMESSLQIPRAGQQTLNVPSGSLKNC